ncbi:MAG: PspC domain-containing protein [Candidatus Edwardsbacteria bacterium]|jgi:phage shock protein PspC (stress-responsive transcriptional regulator)|nr:PspC domain-containing protein [Candidatus Edwardsbacteria bacterium]
MAKKFYRSRTNRMIAGICGGMAEHLDIDPSLVRLIAVALVLAGGLSIWVYLIAWIIVPEQPAA